jgi:UrcA family protein
MLKTIPALAAIVVASALVVPTVSHAATADSVRVSYADLDLGSAVGQDRLQRRIAYAAETVCEVGRSLEVAHIAASNSCRSDAIAKVRPTYEAAVNSARRGTVTVLDAAALIVTAQ